MAAGSTVLMEFFLLIISGLLTGIAEILRRYGNKVLTQIDNLSQQQEEHADDIDANSVMLYGKDGTPWEGFANEVKKNRREITKNSDQLTRHERALKRENIISEESYNPADLDEIGEEYR